MNLLMEAVAAVEENASVSAKSNDILDHAAALRLRDVKRLISSSSISRSWINQCNERRENVVFLLCRPTEPQLLRKGYNNAFRMDVLEMLLKRGANPTLCNDDGAWGGIWAAVQSKSASS